MGQQALSVWQVRQESLVRLVLKVLKVFKVPLEIMEPMAPTELVSILLVRL
jgi:hypothetical protein